ncbi:MAG: FtsX-like permease family protein, partial [Gemmatimonadales bacterium]
RIALGADAGRVQGLVIRQVGIMTVIGGVVGLAAALVIGRAAQSLLFGLESFDLLAFGGAALVIAGVAMTAGYLPARRAARVPPTEALRAE